MSVLLPVGAGLLAPPGCSEGVPVRPAPRDNHSITTALFLLQLLGFQTKSLSNSIVLGHREFHYFKFENKIVLVPGATERSARWASAGAAGHFAHVTHLLLLAALA